jgi:Asp-tRNA(Asn)/Glu-tRNA(Gln) amidotransferase B subunit
MADKSAYTADELKQLLLDLIAARHISLEQAKERVRQRVRDLGQEEPDERMLLHAARKMQDDDLIQTIIDVLPELLVENNRRLIASSPSADHG